MPSLNKVILIANLTRDPQTKQVGQSSVTEFGVAMSRKSKSATGESREETTFVDVTAWGKQGEVIQQYMTKGKQIFLEGRLKFDVWEDKQGGKRSKLSVVVENFQFLPSGQREGGDGPRVDRSTSQERPWRPNPPPTHRRNSDPPDREPSNDVEQGFKDADIPF